MDSKAALVSGSIANRNRYCRHGQDYSQWRLKCFYRDLFTGHVALMTSMLVSCHSTCNLAPYRNVASYPDLLAPAFVACSTNGGKAW